MNFFIRDYLPQDQDSVIQIFKEAFENSPWKEYRKCKNCGVNYGRDEIETLKFYDEGCGSPNGREYEFLKISKDTTKKCESCGSELGTVCKKCGIDMEVKTSKYWAGTRYYTNENLVKYWPYDGVLKYLDYCQKQRNSVSLVSEIKSKVVGFCFGYRLPIEKFPFLERKIDINSGYEAEVAVDKMFWRQGIGEGLTLDVIKSFRENQMKQAIVRTLTTTNAYPLFRKLGFKDIGRVDASDTYENRVYLKKDL